MASPVSVRSTTCAGLTAVLPAQLPWLQWHTRDLPARPYAHPQVNPRTMPEASAMAIHIFSVLSGV